MRVLVVLVLLLASAIPEFRPAVTAANVGTYDVSDESDRGVDDADAENGSDGSQDTGNAADAPGADEEPTVDAQVVNMAAKSTKACDCDAQPDQTCCASLQGAVATDAHNAKAAADSAKAAATVANKVAQHSVKLTHQAQSALKHAQDALHTARVKSDGLSKDQRMSLKKAEDKLKEATKKAEYGSLKDGRYVKGQKASETESKLGKLQDKLDKKQGVSELQSMREELENMKKQLTSGGYNEQDVADILQQIEELQQLIDEAEAAEKATGKLESHDELKAEIGKLQAQIDALTATPSPDYGELHYSIPESKPKVPLRTVDVDVPVGPADSTVKVPLREVEPMEVEDRVVGPSTDEVEPPVEAGASNAVDVDVEMPYGDLEPFGREDTAQELTEASIQESDDMVDQIEKAEVAEEKRSVFRALTRLRGAAITSFDGIARSQTGNIDQYNKINKWRNTHPLHHLADEEADVSKWAFPDNADF